MLLQTNTVVRRNKENETTEIKTSEVGIGGVQQTCTPQDQGYYYGHRFGRSLTMTKAQRAMERRMLRIRLTVMKRNELIRNGKKMKDIRKQKLLVMSAAMELRGSH